MPVSACIHPDTKTGLAATLWRAICSQSSGKSPLHTIPGEHATESGPARDLRIRIYVETGTSRYTSVDRKRKERLDASKTEIPRRSGRSGLEPNIHWASQSQFTAGRRCIQRRRKGRRGRHRFGEWVRYRSVANGRRLAARYRAPPSARTPAKVEANNSTIARTPFRTASDTSSFGP